MIIEDIITQHAEEASFLWFLRSLAVYAPHYSLVDIAELDNRVEAHLDGLRIAADSGWSVCKEALAQEEPGEVFAAATIAFGNGNEDRVEIVLETAGSDLEIANGIISAIGWLPYEQIGNHIIALLESKDADLRRIGIAACAVHRKDPGKALIDALNDNERCAGSGPAGQQFLLGFDSLDAREFRQMFLVIGIQGIKPF